MLTPAGEKRKKEQEEVREGRITSVLQCCFGLFSEKGIESISMNEIAKHSEIGVASLYRYFETKEELVVATGLYAWSIEFEILKKVLSSVDEKANGFEKLKFLLESFSEFFSSNGPFFRFIYYFDAFVKREKISQKSLQLYESRIMDVQYLVERIIREGREDGSITFGGGKNSDLQSYSDEEIYFTVMHSIFSLMQKLSLAGDMLQIDLKIRPEKQIDMLIGIILSVLK